MRFLITAFTSALAVCGITAAGPLERRASLQQVTNFGANTSGTKMYIYVPNKLASNPAVVVAIHYCTGTANAYYAGTPYASLAEKYGFVVIYPESPYSGTCWDVSSRAALTHNGGADSNSIVNMVSYVLDKYNGDKSRVFVTGSSSGAMMTNVLAATYPDVFAAGIVYAGVPATCFYTGTVNGWNSTCSQGKLDLTQEYWANQARNAYPGYNGPRPRMRIHHGTADTTLNVQNYYETIKQWTGVFGYSTTASKTYPNMPASPYTRYIFGPNVEGVLGSGVTHDIKIFGDADMEWFGFTVSATSRRLKLLLDWLGWNGNRQGRRETG
ncbi:putative acetyl xylan esterase [Xylaria bambusicola]|uniref:putative acetyl xylan esterase n=1 Tax=Xylaria bambusicola TaxID=326684 RepID=UPI002007EF8A|nr:putative acetyl xylan esterase [Xylaria bambusicola]KAI0505683.1 putative acetyl xylan esterase [Xylaria bambusicola]